MQSANSRRGRYRHFPPYPQPPPLFAPDPRLRPNLQQNYDRVSGTRPDAVYHHNDIPSPSAHPDRGSVNANYVIPEVQGGRSKLLAPSLPTIPTLRKILDRNHNIHNEEEKILEQFNSPASKLFKMYIFYGTTKWKIQLDKVLRVARRHYAKFGSVEKFITSCLDNYNPMDSPLKAICILRACMELISVSEIQPVRLSEFTDSSLQQYMNETLRLATSSEQKRQVEKMQLMYLATKNINEDNRNTTSWSPAEYGQLTIDTSTFTRLLKELFLIRADNYAQQIRKQTELLYVTYKSPPKYKLDCALELCRTNLGKENGTMPSLKLLLWTLCEMCKGGNIRPPRTLEPQLTKMMKTLLNCSSKTNFDELVSIRQELQGSLPEFVFLEVDRAAQKRYSRWTDCVRYDVPRSRLHYLDLTPEVKHDIVLTLNEFAKYVQPLNGSRVHQVVRTPEIAQQSNFVSRPALFQPQDDSLPNQGGGTDGIESSPLAVINFIDDGPTENCVNYDHFDRNLLFSPVPSNSSHGTESESEIILIEDQVTSRGNPDIAPKGPPLHQLDDFLKSCREEAARIRSENIEPVKISINSTGVAAGSGCTIENRKRSAEAEDNSEKIKKKCILSNKETEKIKQQIIKESNAQHTSVTNPTKPNSFKDAKELNKSKGNGSWIASAMPSKSSIVADEKLPTVATDTDNVGSTTAHKSSKIMADIKRKLQKSQIQSGPKINVVGNKQEILLPLNFKVEEYVDQILSPSCTSQGLKVYGGKYVVYFNHDLTHSQGQGRKSSTGITG